MLSPYHLEENKHL